MKLTAIIITLVLAYKLIKNLLVWAYWLQTKEYRFDRLSLFWQTQAGKQVLKDNYAFLGWWPRPFFRPKLSPRMVLSLATSCLLLLITGFTGWQFLNLSLNLQLFLAGLFLNWLVLPIILLANFLVDLPVRLAKKRLIKLARQKIESRPDLIVIGITGSYGKTSLVHILSHVLKAKYQVLATPENQNTLIAISRLTINKLKKNHQIFIVEMGAYKKGEITQICQMVKPRIGIITAINYQHLGLFGSLGNLLTAKYELIKCLPKDGVAFFNANNQYTRAMADKTKISHFMFGREKQNYPTNLIGAWQQVNIQAALKVADYLDVKKSQALKRLTTIPSFPQQTQVFPGINGAIIIDDSYSSNPDGFLVALDLLKDYPRHKKIVITPGIIELSFKSSLVHKKLAKKMLRLNIDQLILTRPDEIKYFRKLPTVLMLNNLKQIKEQLNIDEKTVILIEGRVPNEWLNFFKGGK